MIKFASSVIPVGQVFPKADRKKFVKIAQMEETIMSQEEAISKFMPEIDKSLNQHINQLKT